MNKQTQVIKDEKAILNYFYQFHKDHIVEFKESYGALRCSFERELVYKGQKYGKVRIVLAEQNPKGSSVEAQLVRLGKLKTSDVLWLYISLGKNRIIWLGKIVKGEAQALEYFHSIDKIWYIY